MIDYREIIRAEDPELARYVARLWQTDEERAQYLREANAKARKFYRPPPITHDRTVETLVGGVCAVLLSRNITPWLSVELSHCFNEARAVEPLPPERVAELCDQVAAREIKRRAAA